MMPARPDENSIYISGFHPNIKEEIIWIKLMELNL